MSKEAQKDEYTFAKRDVEIMRFGFRSVFKVIFSRLLQMIRLPAWTIWDYSTKQRSVIWVSGEGVLDIFALCSINGDITDSR